MDPLITIFEAAELLRMTPQKISRAAKRGDIPCVMLHDGTPRFDVGDLRKWIETQKQPPRQGVAT